MSKLKRLFEYGFHAIVTMALWSVGALLSRVVPEYRDLWLVSERGFDARDNGYRFYEYLKELHPEINARFVITKDSFDYEKIHRLGGAVEYRSLSHFLAFASAKYLVSTHIFPASPDMVLYYHLAQCGIRPRGKRIFLQHGITKDNIQWYHAPQATMELFCCGAMKEYHYISEVYGHPKEVPQYLGLCRFDNLKSNAKRTNRITVVPTWRSMQYPKGSQFPQTAYFQNWQAFLDDTRLHELLERTDSELIFYPHIEIQKELYHFHSKSPRIILSDVSRHDVQELLTTCKLLITDFSSVFFDVAYLDRPTLYFQFDEEEYRRIQYNEGYFDYRRDGFGPVCVTVDELMEELTRMEAADFTVAPVYQERINSFFPVRDTNNCERILNAILNL